MRFSIKSSQEQPRWIQLQEDILMWGESKSQEAPAVDKGYELFKMYLNDWKDLAMYMRLPDLRSTSPQSAAGLSPGYFFSFQS